MKRRAFLGGILGLTAVAAGVRTSLLPDPVGDTITLDDLKRAVAVLKRNSAPTDIYPFVNIGEGWVPISGYNRINPIHLMEFGSYEAPLRFIESPMSHNIT
jgi:hypothetical protein